MSQRNAHEAPAAPVDTFSAQGIDASRVASGQKLVVYAVAIYLLAVLLQAVVGRVAVLLLLPAVILALIGVGRVGSGLGWSLLARVAIVVLMLVPLINLITLLVVNSRATRALRDAGYRVGLLGASKQNAV